MVSSSASVSGAGSYTWGTTAQMVADAQSWLDNPTTNFGWILIGDETTIVTTKRYGSRENSDFAIRPVLTVTFVPP